MYMLHRARGLGLSARVVEAGDGIGGTWYWNRYPGARCDVESMQYSYQFSEELQQEWQWSERYASQPEILTYLNHVADRFDLRRRHPVRHAGARGQFDEAASRWVITADGGQQMAARFLVMATAACPRPGSPTFPASTVSRARRSTPAAGRTTPSTSRAARRVIGTGSSGIQSIPVIARQARDLVVFQRTATYSVPAHNHPLDEAEQRAVKADYAAFRRRNSQTMGAIGSSVPLNDVSALAVEPGDGTGLPGALGAGRPAVPVAFIDLLFDRRANETAADFVRDKIHQIVGDQAVADLLSPRTVIGCKRLCVDTGYYATFNRDNVELVDVSASPIEITPHGPRVGDREFELDCLVFATGFDAMTGALLRIDIRGRGGLSLGEAWAQGPRTYLGLGVAGSRTCSSSPGRAARRC